MERIRKGVLKFRERIFPTHRPQFEKLAGKQEPHTLFITCADSRIVPNLFTHTGPGEMFVERNPGNIIPAYGHESAGELASIEYAVAALNVRHVIVCGHSDCGAMKAILSPGDVSEKLPAVARWIHLSAHLRGQVDPSLDERAQVRQLTELNVAEQLENLKRLPPVAERLAAGKIDLHGWIYEIETGRVYARDETSGRFRLWPE